MKFPRLFAALAVAAGACAWAATPAQPELPRSTMEADLLDMTTSDTESIAIATGNVVFTGNKLKITCDRIMVIVNKDDEKDATIGKFNRFNYLVATGNVSIIQDDREATCHQAEVFFAEEKVVLSGQPVVIDHATDAVAAGEKITMFRGKRQLIVDKPRFSGPGFKDLSANAKDEPAAETSAPPAKANP